MSRTRKVLLLSSVLAAVLAPPAAQAATRIYAGFIDGSPDQALWATTDGAGKKVKSMTTSLTMSCQGAQYTNWSIWGRLGIGAPPAGATGFANLVPSRNSGGRFEAAYTGATPDGTEQGSLKGRFKAKSASGTLRIDATPGSGGTCTTGSTSFKLTRGAGRAYGGSTTRDDAFVLLANRSRSRVTQLYTGWGATCSNGLFNHYGEHLQNFTVIGGRFGDSFQNTESDGTRVSYVVDGKITKKRASGTFSVSFATADGSLSCDSGTIAWSAKSG
jgi:hypothetical protein